MLGRLKRGHPAGPEIAAAVPVRSYIPSAVTGRAYVLATGW